MDCGIGCATYRCEAAERSSVVVAGFSDAERSADVVRMGGLEDGDERARRSVRSGSVRVGSFAGWAMMASPALRVWFGVAGCVGLGWVRFGVWFLLFFRACGSVEGASRCR